MKKTISIDTVISLYNFNLVYAFDLVQDIDENMMYQSLGDGLENHPAFVLGHLVVASEMVLDELGGEFNIPGNWKEVFGRKGPGDSTLPLAKNYQSPTKNELLNNFKQIHNLTSSQLKEKDDHFYSEPIKWRFNRMLSTMGDYITFMCITHEAMHLGQLAAWRRGVKLESSLGRL